MAGECIDMDTTAGGTGIPDSEDRTQCCVRGLLWLANGDMQYPSLSRRKYPIEMAY